MFGGLRGAVKELSEELGPGGLATLVIGTGLGIATMLQIVLGDQERSTEFASSGKARAYQYKRNSDRAWSDDLIYADNLAEARDVLRKLGKNPQHYQLRTSMKDDY